MSLPREFCELFFELAPGVVGLGACESLFTHHKNKMTITEKFLVRHFLSFQQAPKMQELRSVYWIPGLGNPTDGLTETESDMAPLLRLMESGVYNRGISVPLKGMASHGQRFVFCLLGVLFFLTLAFLEYVQAEFTLFLLLSVGSRGLQL